MRLGRAVLFFGYVAGYDLFITVVESYDDLFITRAIKTNLIAIFIKVNNFQYTKIHIKALPVK